MDYRPDYFSIRAFTHAYMHSSAADDNIAPI
jgi:hypothetical protein